VPTTPTRESALKLLPLTAFFILGAISVVIWWVPLTSSFALALRDDQYTHILLILPMSAALIFLDWKAPNPSSGLATSLGSVSLGSASLGSVLLVVAASVTFYVRWRVVAIPFDERLSLNMLALVVWWIAAFILCFGTSAFRRELFPLCFLFGMAPLPGFVLNLIVALLQQGSAAVAHFLFVVARVPVEQQGLLVHIPGLTVEVARECSSIRSSSMLLVTTMVLAQLLLRSPWRKALVVAVAIPLSVVKNGLRIFVIAMLATRVDPSFLTGRLHREGGIIFFLIALGAVFLLLWVFRRGEAEKRGIGSTGINARGVL
jgi:exosortase